ncbi:SDR family oxidoreductase [Luteibacter sp. 9135]|uniref:SDR family oxidoreductase n=1 Tax=Luteibacter sp. 9135 TaxID=1500893 RepID=UPI0005689568|nr:SDR family oxidoreductase [Luteibacter sp. 9135]
MAAANKAAPLPSTGTVEWPGKVVLVTGGAQGIGKGIAEAVLAVGGSVVIGDVDADAGRACLEEWDAAERAAFLALDVSKEASVKRFVAAALKRFGRIDGLVNNAGIADPNSGPLPKLDWSEWKRRIDTNLGGTFLCSKHALPALTRSNGAIVNIASSRAHQSEPDTEAYAASKGGIVAFTHALAISAGPVRVNAINPGWVVVDEWKKPGLRRKTRLSAADHAQHPVGRAGLPPDIGALAVFLLSSQAGFITGENITVDGGVARKMHYV